MAGQQLRPLIKKSTGCVLLAGLFMGVAYIAAWMLILKAQQARKGEEE